MPGFYGPIATVRERPEYPEATPGPPVAPLVLEVLLEVLQRRVRALLLRFRRTFNQRSRKREYLESLS